MKWPMTEYRASFDATVTFANGGGLAAHGFRVDVPSPGIDEAGIASLFVASLGLLMTESVELANVEIIAEPHKGTRGGPSDAPAARRPGGGALVELSHVIRAGMITYPGLPGPEITPHLTREASRGRYSPGTEFAIGRISLVGNTGTYLDAPYHRYADGADLTAIPLERTAGLPAVVVRVTGARRRGIDVGALAALDVRGAAVLLHTGDDTRFGTPAYAGDAHFLTGAGAAWLAGHGGCPGRHRRGQHRRHRRRAPPRAFAASGGRDPRGRAPDRAGAASAGRGLVHRRAAAHRGIRHHPGARVRAAARVGGATRPGRSV